MKNNRWNAVCGESRTHGVEWGKSPRLYQRLTYHYYIAVAFTKYIDKHRDFDILSASLNISPVHSAICSCQRNIEDLRYPK